ncbi:MAG TPA: flagellar hook basal-body protein, partial [Novosphingobium sp.]|nr:flagellar hook basal-body protein [Novosphingobium sp.]
MSFYTSLSGIATMQTDLDVISNNLANAQTAGFKSSTATFADLVATSILTDPALTTGLGARTEKIQQNFGLGSITQTGNTTDIAINGSGFFLTKDPTSGNPVLTRAGSFSVDNTGYLIDGSGARLQMFTANAAGTAPASTTTTSDIQIPTQNASGSAYSGLTVSNTGVLTASYSDGTTSVVGILALANVTSTSGLKQMGAASWETTGLSGTTTYGQASSGQFGSLLSGSLEGSNVNITTELVNLIAAQQDYQANS